MAIDQGNKQIFTYILTILKMRDHMRGLDKNRYWDIFKISNVVVEYKNK